MARFRITTPSLFKGLPASSVRIIAFLISVNVVLWIIAAIILAAHPSLLSAAALA
ncbi:hypothetical protein EV126DRAFT_512429, partial [Verticillium dahliae]